MSVELRLHNASRNAALEVAIVPGCMVRRTERPNVVATYRASNAIPLASIVSAIVTLTVCGAMGFALAVIA